MLRPNFAYLKRCGFGAEQIVPLVNGFPPILIKNIRNSIFRFLAKVMGRRIDEVTDYPAFFRHGSKKRFELRHKLLKQKNIACSLSETLDYNQKKFLMKYGLFEGYAYGTLVTSFFSFSFNFVKI